MQESQQMIEHMHQHHLRIATSLRIGQARFGHLHVITAELVPCKVVQAARRIGKAKGAQGFIDRVRGSRQSAENPTVFQRQLFAIQLGAL